MQRLMLVIILLMLMMMTMMATGWIRLDRIVNW